MADGFPDQHVGKHEGEEKDMSFVTAPTTSLLIPEMAVWTSDWMQQHWLTPRVFFFSMLREVQVIVKGKDQWIQSLLWS